MKIFEHEEVELSALSLNAQAVVTYLSANCNAMPGCSVQSVYVALKITRSQLIRTFVELGNLIGRTSSSMGTEMVQITPMFKAVFDEQLGKTNTTDNVAALITYFGDNPHYSLAQAQTHLNLSDYDCEVAMAYIKQKNCLADKKKVGMDNNWNDVYGFRAVESDFKFLIELGV